MAKQQQEFKNAMNLGAISDSLLLDNVTVTWKDLKWEITDFGGKSKEDWLALHIKLEEDNGTVHEDQWWFAGDPKDYIISEDGKQIAPTGSRTTFGGKTPYGLLIKSLLDGDEFPEDQITDHLDCFDGLKVHMQQMDTGKTRTGQDGKEYPQTALCVSQILKFPWEKSEGKKAARKNSSSSPKTKSEDETLDLKAKAREIVLGIVMGAGEEGVTKKALVPKIMTELKSAGLSKSDGQTIIQMIHGDKDNVISGSAEDEVPWDYEHGVLTISEQ